MYSEKNMNSYWFSSSNPYHMDFFPCLPPTVKNLAPAIPHLIKPLNCIPQIWVHCIFIFIQLKILSNLPLGLFFDLGLFISV